MMDTYHGQHSSNEGGAAGGLRGRKLDHGGLHNGICCNFSGTTEYVLVGLENGCMWLPFPSGSCIGGPGTGIDCEGATCGGGFYKAHGVVGSLACTPFPDDPIASRLRWTPGGCGPWATSPHAICRNPLISMPSGYPWGPHPSTTCAPTAAPSVMPPMGVTPKVTSPPDDISSLPGGGGGGAPATEKKKVVDSSWEYEGTTITASGGGGW